MNSVSCAICVSDSRIRLAMVPRMPVRRTVDVGSCIAGGERGAGAAAAGGAAAAAAAAAASRPADVPGNRLTGDVPVDGSSGTYARSMPSRSASCRAAAVAGRNEPVRADARC